MNLVDIIEKAVENLRNKNRFELKNGNIISTYYQGHKPLIFEFGKLYTKDNKMHILNKDNKGDFVVDMVGDADVSFLEEGYYFDDGLKNLKDGEFYILYPKFIYGYEKELKEEIQKFKLDNEKKTIYPFIHLFMPFDERYINEYEVEVNLIFTIVAKSDSTKNTRQRYKENINTILLPVFKQFIESLKEIGISFDYSNVIRTDQVYWGKNNQSENVFTDYVDAITLRINNAIIQKKSCYA